MYSLNKKKGVSPVIATVLLIAMVIVISMIVFFWFQGLTEETITKFGKKNIKIVCDEVKFQASYSSPTLTISNTGTVPIYNFNLKISNAGGFSTKDLQSSNISWPELGINQGDVFSSNVLSLNIDAAIDLTVIPVLVGNSKKGGQKTYTCEERHGLKITL